MEKITENLLQFMGFGDNNNASPNGARVKYRYKMHKFIEFLNNNEI